MKRTLGPSITARLVTQSATGFDDSEIAAELFDGFATVKSRVARTTTKPQLINRTQLTVYACEPGLAS